MVYKGSDSFSHVPSDPLRAYETYGSESRRSSATSIGNSYGLPPSPGMASELSFDTPTPVALATKKRRLEEPGADIDAGAQDEERLPFSEPDHKTPKDWQSSYREAKLAYLNAKEANLTLKGCLIAKDTQLVEKDQKLVDKDQKIVQLRQDATRVRKITNQRDKTINELERENQYLKIKLAHEQAVHTHLHQFIASMAPERRPHIPSHIPSLDAAVRDSLDYPHPDAPRKGLKNYRRFQPTLPYTAGNGKVGPQKYGSNAFWDLGLCHDHFHTPNVCQHGVACEYRHGLTYDERAYIRFLTKGDEFLRRSDEVIMRKTAGGTP
ncbi:hypothetical protein AA0113_g4684 [Alternaria arborescens]|uniref:C3H1-type domain-containing protein n=1 Tax=Alternaria arborescens TaxID=156630 RepID=A0A4Q4SBS2_9PLEO|nr:hypothetical protein AA0113_g4684 [Alternaria arborescens]